MLSDRSFAYHHAGESVVVELQDHGLLLACRGLQRETRHMLLPEVQFARYMGLMTLGLGRY